MNRKVLLIEPNYKNKFPPIGLMKLATYFKIQNDDVVFFKGDLNQFVIQQITYDCIEKLNQIDNTINWRLRYNSIFSYIKYRKKEYLEEIQIKDSQYEILIYPWLEYYKKYYHSEEYKKHPQWDWVGVTTLFTFYWDITIETINFAKNLVKDHKNLMVGGVLASIQPEEIEKATGIRPYCGTLSSPGDIDEGNDLIIDELPLDYSILDEIDYEYPDRNAYYGYMTRGCIRKCPFCAVPILEPQYNSYIPLNDRITRIANIYGEQQNLLLMDNNVLASKELPQIIEEIVNSGFAKGAKYIEPNWFALTIENLKNSVNDRAYVNKYFKILVQKEESTKSIGTKVEIHHLREKYGLLFRETCTKENILKSVDEFEHFFNKKDFSQKGKLRFVDFNQGMDARLFTPQIAEMLGKIAIRPVRIAFDDIKTEKKYSDAIKMCANEGIKDFSNYLLYNYEDRPEDLYTRLKINIELCEQYNISIYSFPMKYHPIRKTKDMTDDFSHNRDYIGKNWNRKFIRAIQAILNSTKGKIGRGKTFFYEAFGNDIQEYEKLLYMPETMIIYRMFYKWLNTKEAKEYAIKKIGNSNINHYSVESWWQCFNQCKSFSFWNEIKECIEANNFNTEYEYKDNEFANNIMSFYVNNRAEIITQGTDLWIMKQEYDRLYGKRTKNRSSYF